MTILVGCSGWSYDDWVGMFYPVDLAKKKGSWFDYYASYFSTVEINSTFYRQPGEFQVRSWINKAKVKEKFEYSVKMPQLVTHKAMVQGDLKRSLDLASSFERACVKPMVEEGVLGCVLLQLSPYFSNEGDSIGILEGVLDSLALGDMDYAVEFRHRTWLNSAGDELDPAALDALRGRNVACVITDSPGFPITREVTAGHSYIRFHGRKLN